MSSNKQRVEKRESVIDQVITLYAASGWHLIRVHAANGSACQCGIPTCSAPGKHPIDKGWTAIATSDVAEWRRLWAETPHANVGVVTGPKSGIFVVETDVKHDGDASMSQLVAEHGPLPTTVRAISGGGGTHYYFRYPVGYEIRNSTNIRPGIDVRGDGGQIIAAPSLHLSRNPYRWVEGHAPTDLDPADAPGWLLELIINRAKAAPTQQGGGNNLIPDGTRNDTLYRKAVWQFELGLPKQVIEQAIRQVNATQCLPPLAEDEVHRILMSATREAAAKEELTQGGNAQRLIRQFGTELRYCREVGWLAWNGKRWVNDDGLVQERVKAIVSSMRIDARTMLGAISHAEKLNEINEGETHDYV